MSLPYRSWAACSITSSALVSSIPVNSVTVKRKDRLERAIGPTTEYAIYGEFGTTRMRARPFAAPALKDVQPHAEKAMLAAILKFVKAN